ncbi:unnamed protein product [Polarella glacialis]|uniref:Uncharacterized protein n=1 Tax=Polarella glacialis TaxID=89957 RepID=A0A813LMV5_POLGL|nr:unnamed protein product [Polarella glacialis]CAE8729427.1 unnamed protein product [Polarella glacialis]
MDSWPNQNSSTSPSTVEGNSRKTYVKTDVQTRSLAVAGTKLAVFLADRSRLHDARLQKALLLPEKHPVVQVALQAGKAFHQSKQKAGKDVSNPHLWVWRAIITAACELPSENAEKAILMEHRGQTTSPDMLKDTVFHCRINQTFREKAIYRICFVVAPPLDPVLDALLRVLVANGGQLKVSKPPRAALERSALQMLRNVGEWMPADTEGDVAMK